MFTDTHSHIHFSNEFPDIEQIILRAQESKVSRQIIVGCTPHDSLVALEFVKKYADKNFWSTLGVHPHNADECTEDILKKFTQIVQENSKIVALGEIGLDYFRNLQPKDLQQNAFRKQLELALKLNLPVVVHIRDAWNDALEIMKSVGNTKVILHCFTGQIEQAKIAWERGYYLSFSGVLTYPKNDYLRQIAAQSPADKILIETDCPYLTPQPYRGKRNEPAFVVETAKELAKVRNISLDDAANLTTENAKTIFGIS